MPRARRPPGMDTLIVLPVRDMVLFPGTVFPIALGRGVSIAAAQQAVREEKQIGILMQRDAAKQEPTAGDFHSFGTVANVLRYISTPDGQHHVVVQGESRFQVEEFLHEQPFFRARVRLVVEPEQRSPDIEARFINLKRMALEALQLLPQVPSDLVGAVQGAASPSGLTDLVAAYLDFEADKKQELIETIDPVARIDKVTAILAHRHRGAAPHRRDRPPDQGDLRRAPEGGRAARADGRDPEAARRGRRRPRPGGGWTCRPRSTRPACRPRPMPRPARSCAATSAPPTPRPRAA